MKGLVFDVQRGALTNGPGIRTTVFLKGCPLNCAWCHNPESKSFRVQIISKIGEGPEQLTQRLRRITKEKGVRVNQNYEFSGPEGKETVQEAFTVCEEEQFTVLGKWVGVEEIMTVVERDQKFYGKEGGLTISGGEPLAQPQFTLALLKEAKNKGIHTCVDTSGYCSKRHLKASLPVTDLYLFDMKLFNASEHKKYTGKDNHRILKNLQFLLSQGALVRVRFPMVPGINDTDDFLESIGDFYHRHPSVSAIELMPYENYWLGKYPQLVQNNGFQDTKSLHTEKLGTMVEKLKKLKVPVIN